jgi:iron complex outermembrane recepter protein
LQFDSSAEDWSVALWVKNLADEEYRSSGIDLQASFGYDYSHIGAPRTYGAELTYRF